MGYSRTSLSRTSISGIPLQLKEKGHSLPFKAQNLYISNNLHTHNSKLLFIIFRSSFVQFTSITRSLKLKVSTNRIPPPQTSKSRIAPT